MGKNNHLVLSVYALPHYDLLFLFTWSSSSHHPWRWTWAQNPALPTCLTSFWPSQRPGTWCFPLPTLLLAPRPNLRLQVTSQKSAALLWSLERLWARGMQALKARLSFTKQRRVFRCQGGIWGFVQNCTVSVQRFLLANQTLLKISVWCILFSITKIMLKAEWEKPKWTEAD